MLNPANSLLAALLSTTVAVTAALGWAGWRLLDQQRVLDEQRARDRAENIADLVAAGIRGKLAETGERLSGWVSDPSFAVPAIEGAVVVGARGDRIDIVPPGGLPFAPLVMKAATTTTFAAIEAIEFAGDAGRAAAGYRALARDSNDDVRAGALVRLGRVQRKTRDFSGALTTYEQLTALGAARSDDLPAELAGLNGLRATYLAQADQKQADAVGERILEGLDQGRWLIARGTAELYREPFARVRPESWTVANALSEIWRDADGRMPARGQRIIESANTTASSILVVWRSNGESTAALAVPTDRFFDRSAAGSWQLVDPEGHVIAGSATAPERSIARIIGNSEYPWTLHAWPDVSVTAGTSSRTILLGMMGAMLTFVWAAAYFMARAIGREAAVARLQSDFVAAVSHEFRSPLTTVRQMAEMLDDDRVPTDERRHKYYRIIGGEATRLQRLVETLLHFGRIEAGAERYRFVDLDAAALVREVVGDMETQARESGMAIEVEGPIGSIRVRADQSALSVALRNLIDNAIKYSPGTPIVRVRWGRDQDRAAISVVDCGAGIPHAEQQSVFGKFVRGRAAIDANIKGTGIGLSMVQQIATAHGGEIRLESEPGRGSTFTLLVPAAN